MKAGVAEQRVSARSGGLTSERLTPLDHLVDPAIPLYDDVLSFLDIKSSSAVKDVHFPFISHSTEAKYWLLGNPPSGYLGHRCQCLL